MINIFDFQITQHPDKTVTIDLHQSGSLRLHTTSKLGLMLQFTHNETNNSISINTPETMQINIFKFKIVGESSLVYEMMCTQLNKVVEKSFDALVEKGIISSSLCLDDKVVTHKLCTAIVDVENVSIGKLQIEMIKENYETVLVDGNYALGELLIISRVSANKVFFKAPFSKSLQMISEMNENESAEMTLCNENGAVIRVKLFKNA